MSSGDELGRKAQPKDALTLDPQVCTPEPEGRLDKIWPVDLGEQVVGSKHEFEVPPPRNLSSIAAVGQASVSGSGDLSVAWPMSMLGAGVLSGPLRLTYAPSAAGAQRATLTLIVKWTDGHVETRHVQVTARARAIEDVPESHKDDTTAKKRKGPTESNTTDRPLQVGENALWLNVNNAHGRLIREQGRGVELVAKEAEKFKPKPAERSIWQDLAELAFQLGTGAIAGLVSKYVATRLAKAFVNSAPAVAAAEAGKQGVAAAEKGVQNAQGSPVDARAAQGVLVAKKVGNYAAEDNAAHAKWAEGELTGQLAGGLGRILSTVATEIRAPQDASKDTTAKQQEQDEAPVSEDGEIAFFSVQQSMIDEAGSKGSTRLNSIIAENLKAHPEIAPDLMQGVTAGLDEAAAQAKRPQADQTAEKFFAYLARTNLGTQSINGPGETEKTVTDMSKQRHFENPVLTPSLASGVLEIHATHDTKENGNVVVTGARAKDISYLVANRLLRVPLVHSGVPVRISLHGGLTIITVDEAGRVRVAGAPLMHKGSNTEIQQLKEAQHIVDVVMSKTLAAWGVQQVQTNDARQPAIKQKESAPT